MAFAVGLSLLGCSSDDDSDKGAAPTISNLTLAPLDLETGKVTNLSGTVSISDADGDVTQVGVDAKLPDGRTQSLPSAPAQGANGVKEGQLALALAFGPPAAGAYELSLFVIDAKGNQSNRLTVTVTAK